MTESVDRCYPRRASPKAGQVSNTTSSMNVINYDQHHPAMICNRQHMPVGGNFVRQRLRNNWYTKSSRSYECMGDIMMLLRITMCCFLDFLIFPIDKFGSGSKTTRPILSLCRLKGQISQLTSVQSCRRGMECQPVCDITSSGSVFGRSSQ